MLDFNKIIKQTIQPGTHETGVRESLINSPSTCFAVILENRLQENRATESLRVSEAANFENTGPIYMKKPGDGDKKEYRNDAPSSEERPNNIIENAPGALKNKNDKNENSRRENTELKATEAKNHAKDELKDVLNKIKTNPEAQKGSSKLIKNKNAENAEPEKLTSVINQLGILLQQIARNINHPAQSLKELGESLEKLKARPDMQLFRQILTKIKSFIANADKKDSHADISALMKTVVTLGDTVKNLSEKNKKQNEETKSEARKNREIESHKSESGRIDTTHPAKNDPLIGKKGDDANGFSHGLNQAKAEIRRDGTTPVAMKNSMGEQFQNILEQAKIVVHDHKNSSFTVKLHPKELGSVNMNLGLEKGVVTGKFIVETAEAKDLLQQNLLFIKQELAEAGISVGEFLVNVRDEGKSFFANNESDQSGYTLPAILETNEIADKYSLNSYSLHDGSINLVI